jgi:hypothetical protein
MRHHGWWVVLLVAGLGVTHSFAPAARGGHGVRGHRPHHHRVWYGSHGGQPIVENGYRLLGPGRWPLGPSAPVQETICTAETGECFTIWR